MTDLINLVSVLEEELVHIPPENECAGDEIKRFLEGQGVVVKTYKKRGIGHEVPYGWDRNQTAEINVTYADFQYLRSRIFNHDSFNFIQFIKTKFNLTDLTLRMRGMHQDLVQLSIFGGRC